MSKKLMIVGGTGFLGYYTTKLALSKGYEVSAIAIDDVELGDWWPKEVNVTIKDVFEASEDELVELLKGYDYMIYSVGPDDRITPKAPSYDFFHERLVVHASKVFRAAERAGIKKSVVYNSYFAYFARRYPELEMEKKHPYIRVRVEQAKLLNEQKKNMEVVTLELPYIFGSMPGRQPIWRGVFLDRFAYGKKIIFFPKGSTTMIAVEHIAEAGIGGLEYGKDGERYPIGDENKSFNWMLDTMMIAGRGKKKKIINPSGSICALGAKMTIIREDKKKGLEPGLDYELVMKEIMSSDLVVEKEVLDEVCEKLHISRGGLEEAIYKTMEACYPNKSFK